MNNDELLQKLSAYLDGLMASGTPQRPGWNQELLRGDKVNRWNYMDGCMMTAILAMHAHTGEQRYLDFADGFVGAYVRQDGSIAGYDPQEYNLDNVSPARNLLPLYRLTGKEKYRLAMNHFYAQLKTTPRTHEGSFWHKKIYPWQVWLDGLYMAMPFYMAYDTAYCGMAHFRDIFTQFMTVRTRMRDQKTGLYYHGYDESRAMPWANTQTGCSANFWSRSLGWLVMALTDTLQGMDEQLYYEYRMLQQMLRELVTALMPWQDESGMFWQVTDHPGEAGNYLETSGSAMIAYGILKAVRLRLLPARFRAMGEKAFLGVTEKRLTIDDDGELTLGGICLVAGLGGENNRDGTRAYYYSEPVVANEAKGVAPLLLAMTEMIRIGK